MVSAIRVLPSDNREVLPEQKFSELRRLVKDDLGSSDHRVSSLPLVEDLSVDLYAGLLNASGDGDKKFFYWLVAPEDAVAKASPNTPILIWLNGGPGCSSNDGFFLENGPFQFAQGDDSQWKLVDNPYSWHLAPAWVLYIDQPVGTGLSITKSRKYPKNDLEVDIDFLYFLEEFLLFHGEKFLDEDKAKANNPIYFSGESHAGHYIPSMMDYIHGQPAEARIEMTLGGAAIGNGWIDPFNQYAAADIAYGLGFINLAQKSDLDTKEKACQNELSQGNFKAGVCFTLLDEIVAQSYGGDVKAHASMYDARNSEIRGAPRTFPRGHKLIEVYLGAGTHANITVDSQDVLKAIHATESLSGQRYQECTDPPYLALAHQDGLGVTQEIANLLESDIPMLFYNGMDDLICNHVGTEKSLMRLNWSKIQDWIMANRFTWTLGNNEKPAAFVHEHLNLIYLKIPNSGHMVPQDQPEVAFNMIQNFLHSKTFRQNTQQLQRSAEIEKSC